MNKEFKAFVKENPGIFEDYEVNDFINDKNVTFLKNFESDFGEEALYFVTNGYKPSFVPKSEFKAIKSQIKTIKQKQASDKQLGYLKGLLKKSPKEVAKPLSVLTKIEASELIAQLSEPKEAAA